MVFKRKNKRSYLQVAQESVYPKGGWGRAASYIAHRLRRLPDPPQRIARGIAAGVFVSFTPLFGLHFIAAAFVAIGLRGNVIAAMLSTFVGNPLTFPFIAALALQIGNRVLGTQQRETSVGVFEAFSRASGELWWNFTSLFRPVEAHWDRLHLFFDTVFLPYMVGGLVPGLIAGLIAYALSKPVIAAYQRRRARSLNRTL
ncbi:MAG: DUF2062 domain-containing protein [Pseudomonadota bacterium]